jgi:endonuclease-3
VDTHIHRLAQRWGLTPPSGSVEATEADLKALFAQEAW